MKAGRKLVLGSGVLLLTCGMVLAQEAGQSIVYSVGTSVEMTDNRDASENDEVDNIDVFLKPSIEFNADGRVSTFSFEYVPSLRYRTDPGDNQDETDILHDLELKWRYQLSRRARLRFSDRFRIEENPQVEEGGAIVRADTSYTLNNARLGLNYDLGDYSNLDFLLSNMLRRYDEDAIATTSDKDMTGLRLQHRMSLSDTLRTLLTGGFQMYGYEDSALYGSRDFTSFIGAVGLEKLLTPNVIGSLSVGYQSRDYDNANLDGDGSAYFKGDISGLVNPDLRIGSVIEYGLRDSDAFPYASQEYTDFRGYADMRLAANTSLVLAGTYRLSTYDEALAYGLSGGDEDVIVLDAQLKYALTEQASVMVGQRFEDISADATVGSSYTRNTTRAGATFSF